VVRPHTVNAFSLDEKVALITGGGRGIGAAIAQAFVGAGAAVAVSARTTAEIEAVAADIRATGGNALAVTADVSDPHRLPGLIDEVVGGLGRLDILVNNAGGGTSPPFVDTRIEHLESAFHMNVAIPFELARLAVPHLLEQSGSSILNMSSQGARKAARGNLAYHVAKAALAHMTRLMAADLGPRIRVNALLPGAVETQALRNVFESRMPELRDVLLERTRLRRVGQPDDVANAAVYLASPAASWLTGVLLDVDGGTVDELLTTAPDL
jgi:7-alpha-hydroxysteroid dehydrogenase